MPKGSRCCIVGCRATSHSRDGAKIDDGRRFFVIPGVKRFAGDQAKELTTRRRLAWITAISRPDVTFERESYGLRVCSKHFHKGAPAYEMMVKDPDWVPSLHLGHGEVNPSNLDGYTRPLRKSFFSAASCASADLVKTKESEGSSQPTKSDALCQTDLPLQETGLQSKVMESQEIAEKSLHSMTHSESCVQTDHGGESFVQIDHEGEDLLKCSHCDAQFDTIRDLGDHVLARHMFEYVSGGKGKNYTTKHNMQDNSTTNHHPRDSSTTENSLGDNVTTKHNVLDSPATNHNIGESSKTKHNVEDSSTIKPIDANSSTTKYNIGNNSKIKHNFRDSCTTKRTLIRLRVKLKPGVSVKRRLPPESWEDRFAESDVVRPGRSRPALNNRTGKRKKYFTGASDTISLNNLTGGQSSDNHQENTEHLDMSVGSEALDLTSHNRQANGEWSTDQLTEPLDLTTHSDPVIQERSSADRLFKPLDLTAHSSPADCEESGNQQSEICGQPTHNVSGSFEETEICCQPTHNVSGNFEETENPNPTQIPVNIKSRQDIDCESNINLEQKLTKSSVSEEPEKMKLPDNESEEQKKMKLPDNESEEQKKMKLPDNESEEQKKMKLPDNESEEQKKMKLPDNESEEQKKMNSEDDEEHTKMKSADGESSSLIISPVSEIIIDKRRVEKEYICKDCKVIFTSLRSYLNHKMADHEGKELFKCGLCEAAFPYKSTLKTHMKSHSDVRLFTCVTCGKRYKSKSNLNTHMGVHVKSVMCDRCGRRFKDRHDLIDHMMTTAHSDDMPFVCTACGIGFPFQWLFDSHMSKCNQSRKLFVCKKCNKSFNNISLFESHKRSEQCCASKATRNTKATIVLRTI